MASPRTIERRVAVIKAEMEFDFPGVVQALENGLRFLNVTEEFPAFDFNPDSLRSIGALVMLCKRHGATVIFPGEGDFAELNSKRGTNHSERVP